MMASRFKATCLAVLDDVERSRRPLVVTKHGRPVARVVPIDHPDRSRPTAGSVRLLAEDDAAYYGTGERWQADAADE